MGGLSSPELLRNTEFAYMNLQNLLHERMQAQQSSFNTLKLLDLMSAAQGLARQPYGLQSAGDVLSLVNTGFFP